MQYQTDIYASTAHLDGFFEDIKDVFKPPKALRKALERMFTLPKPIRRAITPPKAVEKWIAKAMYPPKSVRKTLIKPKWLRKTFKQNPWLEEWYHQSIKNSLMVMSAIPFPGAMIVASAVESIYNISESSPEIAEMKRTVRRAAQEEANIIAAEEIEIARGIPRKGFTIEERAEAMHQLALWSAAQHTFGNFQEAADARLIYEDARFNAHNQDMVVLMIFGNPTEALHEANEAAIQQGLTEVDKILDTIPPDAAISPLTTFETAPAVSPLEMITKAPEPPWGLIVLGVGMFLLIKSQRRK